MPQNIPRRPIYWPNEPARPGLVQQLADLVALYRVIRDKAQPAIDKSFDEVSRTIGFVIATTLPVAVTIDDKSIITSVTVGGGQFKGTLFDSKLTEALKPLDGQAVAGAKAGTYNIHAIWQAALALALQHHWLEPAHAASSSSPFAVSAQRAEPQLASARPVTGVREPAHFLDAGIQLAPEDTVVIAAIDQVYPELRLAERVAAARIATRSASVIPHAQERVHSSTSSLLNDRGFVAALDDLVQKHGR
jgi:hypothetical protein